MLKTKHLPGLAVAALIASVAFVVEYIVKNNTPVIISPLVIAVVLGALVSNLVCYPKNAVWARVCGAKLAAARHCLAWSTTFILSSARTWRTWIGVSGRRCRSHICWHTMAWQKDGLSSGLSLLVATGFSICGASAIAAMRPVSDADDDDMAYAIASRNNLRHSCDFSLPAIGEVIGFSGAEFGSWVGASVHDVAQTVATAASANDDAQNAAIVVKLTRVMLLAPLVAAVSFHSPPTIKPRKCR